MFLVYRHLNFTLIDLGSTYSVVSSYYAPMLYFSSDSLSMKLYVSTLLGGSIVIEQVCRLYVVII